MAVLAIADVDAGRELTPEQYRALVRNEPRSLTLEVLGRAGRSYDDRAAAVDALTRAGGGWLFEEDGELTWIATAPWVG